MLVNYAQEKKNHSTHFLGGSLTDALSSGNVSCGAAPVILGFAFSPLSSA
jgi:hypothetical protein